MSAVLRLGRARTTRVVDLIGNDVAADHKKREKSAQKPERTMTKPRSIILSHVLLENETAAESGESRC